jgi:hypothetical protein
MQNDLIYRQAAIDAMDDIANFVCVKDEDYILQEEAIDNLKQLPSAQQWIPCSERLPEEKQDVLLLMPQNMVVGFWEDVLSDGGRTWYANSGNGYFTDMDVLYGYDDPIAWMPLPKPYGGDEE